jgi:tetratricopeptide (TPR) repeat protein
MPRARVAAGAALLCLIPLVARPQAQPAFAQAESYVKQGKFAEAIPMLEALVASSPNDLKARNLLGIALLSSGRQQEAAAQFQKALELNPRFVAAMKNLGVCELALGRRAGAKAHFEQALKLAPDDATAHFFLGEIYFAGQSYDRAAAQYERSGGMHLKDPEAALRYVRSAAESNRSAAAIAAGEQLMARGYRKAELYSALAKAYEQERKTQQAYDALRAATELEPKNEANYLDLMSLCLTHNMWDVALEVAGVALAHIPQAYRVRLEKGAVLALKGDLEAADREFQAAGAMAPEAGIPLVAMGLLRMQMGRLAEAIEVLRKCRAQHPKEYVVNWILGEALSQQGLEPGTDAEKEAAQALEAAVRANARASEPRVLLGRILVKRGDLGAAIRQFEAALKIQPDDVSASYQLALLYQRTGNTKRADVLFEQVRKARSVDPAEANRRNLMNVIREGSGKD